MIASQAPQSNDVLFAPLTLGTLVIPNRLFMAPMTRSRAVGGLVTPLHAEYYTQRAGAGLIISESTQPNVVGQGYIQTPGIHSSEQVAAWKTVTDAVHGAGGRIFVQLTHCGRIGHPVLYPNGEFPLAPSAVASREQLFTGSEMIDHPVPREMTAADIVRTIEDFEAAAKHALDAGFDGVELHGANGYLLHQFLADNTNLRDDAYGGSFGNRIRFVIDVVDAVAAAIGPERTALKVSPANPFNGIVEQAPAAVYRTLMAELATRNLGYVHVSETGDRAITKVIRDAWPGTLVLNPHATPGAFPATPAAAVEALASGDADAVSLATMWLANPDLDVRIKAGGPYNSADPATFYGGDHHGYIDYPTLNATSPGSTTDTSNRLPAVTRAHRRSWSLMFCGVHEPGRMVRYSSGTPSSGRAGGPEPSSACSGPVIAGLDVAGGPRATVSGYLNGIARDAVDGAGGRGSLRA